VKVFDADVAKPDYGVMQDTPAFVFVFPNVLNGRVFDKFDYHLGTGYLRAYLAKNGVRTAQFLQGAEKPVAEIAGDILAVGASMVGFSCYDANYFIVRLIADEIRRQSPSVPIVFGGPSATFSDLLIMSDCPSVDICCRSYAEQTSLDLVRWARGECGLDQVDGITYRHDGRIQRNPDRKGPKRQEIDPGTIQQVVVIRPGASREIGGELDIYPDPYVTGFIPPNRVSDIGLVTSRGCTYSCTFCNFSAMSGRSIATHSIGYQLQVFSHLNSVLDSAPVPTMVTINDDNFSLQGRRFHDLLRSMQLGAFRNLRFWAEMRTEPLKEETFDLLKLAGFAEINFGLESAVPRVLAAMKKVRSTGWERDDFEKEKTYLKRIAWAVRKAREAGIETTVSVIFGGPTETLADGQHTLDYIKDIGVDSYAHNFMVVGDGTELAGNFQDFGLKNENRPDRVLPPVTTLTYNVYELPILDHDRSWLPMSGFEMRQVNLYFTGAGSLPARSMRPRGNGRGGSGRLLNEESRGEHGRGPVVGIHVGSVDEATATWLARVLPMNSSVWLLHKKAAEKRASQALFDRAGVAIPELNTLREVENSSVNLRYRVNEFAENAPDYNTRVLEISPFNRRSMLNSEPPAARRTVMYSVTTRADLSSLTTLVGAGSAFTEWSFSPELVAARTAFQDSCRWCSSECPASKLDRIMVAADKTIRPCMNGRTVGRVGDSMEHMGGQVLAMEGDARSKRGCATCEVRESCAKCLFTDPFTVDEYCSVQKSRPMLSSLFDGLSMVRGLLDNGLVNPQQGPFKLTTLRSLDEGEIAADGFTIPLRDCVLLTDSAGADAYVYCQRAEFLATMRADHAIALRLLVTHGRAASDTSTVNSLSVDLGAAQASVSMC
jgi:radical SAM superfamily enzyme YgiQ (UPF0313 family)